MKPIRAAGTKRLPRPVRPTLSEAMRDQLIADYEAGVPVETIARRFNVDASYPSILAKRRAIPRRNKKRVQP